MSRKRRWVKYECLNSSCNRVSPVTKKQKSGILICLACGYPVKKVREIK